MERRLDADKKYDIICAAFQENLEQVENIRELVDSLVRQSQICRLECLQSFLEDFEEADTLPRLEQRNIEAILAALEFEGMDARRQQVVSSVGNTFKWIITKDAVPKGHPDLKVSFKKWLSDGTGVFHITGKPGSGKSTMMKLIDQDAATQKQLENWASATGGRLIIARFYIWKAANAHYLQNQEEGLTRTLLHQILTAAPELTRVIFAKHPCWAPQEYRLINILSQRQEISTKIHFEPREILAALESIFRIQQYRVFLLIDGMDEFEKAHNHHAIAKRVLQWSSGNLDRVKICVSSREDNVFMDRFSADQRLRLHIITKNDVCELVKNLLMEHDVFAERSTKSRQVVIDKIVDRAEGVFLWVVLTIQELKLLLDDRQSTQTVLKAVDELPKEMDEFFCETLSRIPAGYKKDSDAIFSVVTSTFAQNGELDLFHYSMLQKCIENDELDVDHNNHNMSLSEAASQIQEFRSRLPSLCKGLLETTTREGTSGTIQCIHRSVFDFLRGIMRNVPAAVDSDFLIQARGESLAIRSIAEVVRVRPMGAKGATPYEPYIGRVLCRIKDDTLLHTYELNSIFLSLKTLDEALLHKQKVIEVITPFELTALGATRLDNNVLSVFAIAFSIDFYEYIAWALKNYPPWILTDEAKLLAAKECLSSISGNAKYGGLHAPKLPVRCLTELRWLSINDPLLANLSGTFTLSFFPVQRGSIWVNYLIFLMDYDRVERLFESPVRIEDALSAGAEPRIRFKWWFRGGSPNSSHCSTRKPDMVRMKPFSPDEMPSDRSRTHYHRDMSSKSQYEMTIEVGDAHELECTHVLRGPWKAWEHSQLIRLFVECFGKPSGSATFKDLMVVLVNRDPIPADDLSQDERDRMARDCLKTIDDALARVGMFSTANIQSDSPASRNTTDDSYHPDIGATKNSDQKGAQHASTTPADPSSRLSWIALEKDFHSWQTVLISSLSKPRPCHRSLPPSTWRIRITD